MRKLIDWNAIAATSLQGWSLDELVKVWAGRAQAHHESCCRSGDCEHNAARTLLALIRLVEHLPIVPTAPASMPTETPQVDTAPNLGHKLA